ncbi:MAG: ABC transporter substrate-binding protein [Anaerolineae bacterium]|jgi:iron complex transport system substrate-binding protein
MKRLAFIGIFALGVIVFASCVCPTPMVPMTPTAGVITVEDGVGNVITLESEPQRIISLAPNHTEILYALGLGDRVVGVTEYCNYPPEAAEKTKVGDFVTIDLEQVVGLEPDLVLATTMHMVETVPALQEQGIAVFVLDPQSASAVMDEIQKIGQVTGREEAAQALIADMQSRIDAVQERVKDAPRPKVFWELGPELFTSGPGSFINDLIVLAGGENVAADADSPWPQLSVEAIVLKDPDVIVLADHNYGQTAEMIKERPGWEDIRAVKEGRIIEIVDEDIVSRPGPRLVEGLEFLAKALHPDLFE